MQKNLSISFADIIISVIADESFDVADSYKPFLCDGEPVVAIQAFFGSIPEMDLKKTIFHSGGSWNLHRSDDRWILSLNALADSGPQRLAVFDRELTSGQVYVRRNGGERFNHYPLAYPLDELLTIHLLARGRGVLLHACGINDRGEGILFSGTSGAGKSTSANLWKAREGVTLLSDDRVIVRKQGDRFWIYGTPWHGDAHIASPQAVPLDRIFIIKHDAENNARRLTPADAVSRLLVRSFSTFWCMSGMDFTLEFLTQLSETVPCYELGFVPEQSMVDFVRCL